MSLSENLVMFLRHQLQLDIVEGEKEKQLTKYRKDKPLTVCLTVMNQKSCFSLSTLKYLN